MKQRTILSAVVVAVSALIGLGWLADNRYTEGSAESPPGVLKTAPDSRRPKAYASQSQGMLQGVLEPLHSLQVMQHALALSPDLKVSELPAIALLGSTLQTTGLGPIRIGMTLDDVFETGIELEPMQASGPSECEYYRIKNSLEPIGFMAVENKIIRVDVWQGSLITTRSGIAIGSSEADILREYPNQIEAVANPNTGGKTFIFTPQDPGEDIYRLVFETDARGQVVQYRAGQFPSVTWAEGCL